MAVIRYYLKFDWGSKIPAVLSGIYSLSILAEDFESEYYIAEQEIMINQNPSLKLSYSLSTDIISQRDFNDFSYLKLKSTVSYNNNILLVLDSKLIKTKKQKLNNSQKLNINRTLNSKGSFSWKTFSKEEIESFANLSGDLNSIHLNSDPVVQGMLILLIFEDFLLLGHRRCFSLLIC